ncbi:MAG: serine/threonine-protein phosphatase [Cytophagales bacterium]|nr:serine/threonine-protein phosphatase [Armatimonadota bacterium]
MPAFDQTSPAAEARMPPAVTAADGPTDEMEAGAIQKAWAALSLTERRPAIHLEIDWAARTDIGRAREHNEDKYDFFLPEDPSLLALRGRLWALADGMGGHSAGQIASESALKILIRRYFSQTEMGGDSPRGALAAALRDANDLLHRAAKEMGAQGNMGTTVVAAVICNDALTIAHIGDSRAYLLRGDKPIRALTTDHSWVEEQVRRGTMSREQAETSQYRNYIMRSVGMGGAVDADIASETLQIGDTILLCSDGVTGYLEDATLERLIQGKNLSQAALDLIDAANEAGGRDNSTVLLFRVRALRPFE